MPFVMTTRGLQSDLRRLNAVNINDSNHAWLLEALECRHCDRLYTDRRRKDHVGGWQRLQGLGQRLHTEQSKVISLDGGCVLRSIISLLFVRTVTVVSLAEMPLRCEKGNSRV